MSAQEISVTLDGRMSAADAAAYIDLKPKTMAMHRVYGGGPPFVKTGRIWYFKADLDDWIQARRVTTTAELAAKKRTGEVATSQIPRANNRRSDARKKAPAKPAGKSGRRVASKGKDPGPGGGPGTTRFAAPCDLAILPPPGAALRGFRVVSRDERR